jgi:hypothetical protein
MERSERLCLLLFDGSDEYKGPLSDGFQVEDIMVIIQITGNWIFESYTTVLNTDCDNVADLYNTPTLVHLCIDILLSLQKKGVLQIEMKYRFMLKSITKLFHPSMDEMLTSIQKHASDSCSCMSSSKKRDKRVQKYIQKKSKNLVSDLPSKK